ncbi:hypothetical protein BLA29_004980 [Euroglyphus maynei]|uniref:Death domain-containing protein n=1 Tax=Euroglyphus maynei TaxID=6958 RepID=A0A1Y3BR40_EURMA|nr:hypothetical protein BLA29_004980 [Euroglyphus maynei]
MDSYLNTIDDGQSNDDDLDIYSNNIGSPSSSSTLNMDRIRNHTTTTTNGVHLLPLYISMLVIIVFTFCIYALIQLKCNNSIMLRVDHQRVTNDSTSLHMHNHQTKLLPTPPPPPYNANNVMPLFSSSLNKKESIRYNHYGKKTYNNEQILNKSNSGPTSTTSTTIQSVPLISDDVEHLTIEIRQALENMLGKDTMIWRLLAKELGYDEKHIVQFETKATTIMNGQTVVDTFKAIRLLLLDWSSQMTTSPDDYHQHQQQQSTETGNSGPPSLATLSNALIRIGRVDCARIVVRQNHYQQQQR